MVNKCNYVSFLISSKEILFYNVHIVFVVQILILPIYGSTFKAIKNMLPGKHNYAFFPLPLHPYHHETFLLRGNGICTRKII